ncbi:hypothetical protein D9756_011371 [Leucocoprinus leucothites]|uniref:Nephrocystin 3-like N-terminal domain-containing protein n=1 Tax=Leucocoprinus leucothites TaxID=201217 RepID=A0A8H5FQW1_9AGAR|nr:hypothetical protein D9756_011371 [Leucoagaricus leucothites]
MLCYPGTRVTLIEKIIHWLEDHSRTSNILWLYGSRSAGKSTLAQTIKSRIENQGENHPIPILVFERFDPRGIIFGLVEELGSRYPEYRKLFWQTCVRTHIQTTEQLFTAFFTSLLSWLDMPSFIFILDDIERRHLELIELIAAAQQEQQPAILWLISSQEIPEIQSCLCLSATTCIAMKVPSGREPEAVKDIELYLRDGLRRIFLESTGSTEGHPLISATLQESEVANAHPSQMAPLDGSSIATFNLDTAFSQTDFSRILRACSNMFLYAHGFLQFLQEAQPEDLNNRLQSLFRLIDQGGKDCTTNVYSLFPLDGGYYNLMIPKPGASLVDKQLIISVIDTSSCLTRTELSLLLGLPEGSVASILYNMHSIISIAPRAFPGDRHPVSLSHPAIFDYLTTKVRSKELFIDPDVVYPRLTRACITAIQQKRHCPAAKAPPTPFLMALYYINIFSVTYVWDFSRKISDPGLSRSVAREFIPVLDTLRLQAGQIPVIPFVRFLVWLKELHLEPDVVRTIAGADAWRDQELIDACETLAEPLEMNSSMLLSDNFSFGNTPRFVILGLPKNPMLVILIDEGVTMYSRKDLMS